MGGRKRFRGLKKNTGLEDPRAEDDTTTCHFSQSFRIEQEVRGKKQDTRAIVPISLLSRHSSALIAFTFCSRCCLIPVVVSFSGDLHHPTLNCTATNLNIYQEF
ncbi:hypothetical protein L2E82_37471 [Cichorium intybus]|uniref:Uncharacterized protein n=1 Tax=Cichorium intybus TaxID=13427 RepID=A0ACB9AE56_CICIN|nr:hypothetical protein L2E82_37471 [Cichorium intybus]